MRTVFLKKLFACLVLSLVLVLPLRAQTMHYVGLSGQLGYSAMFDNVTLSEQYTGRNAVVGGVGAGLGLKYELQLTQFRFHTGLDFDFMNAATRLGDFSAMRALALPNYPTMKYRYDYMGIRETRNVGYLSLPLMFGAYFNRYYFFVGPKVGVNLLASYSMKGDVAVKAVDDELIGDIENIPNHGLDTYEWGRDASPLELGLLNVSVAGEFGVNLDEWLAPKPKRRRGGRRGRPQPKTFKESLHYRAGIYAEYGVLNINNYSGNNIANLDGNLTGNAIPAYVTGNGVSDMGMATQLGTAGAEKASLNPFFVGAKFTILYEIPKRYKKPQPRPKPRPKPQPKPKPTVVPPPPHLAGILVDAETQQRLGDVQVILYDAEDNVVFEGATSASGVFGTVLGAGTYGAFCSKPGYLSYDGDIVFTKDSIFISMTALKEKKKIVINDLFFATAKTTILPESEAALEELYYLLIDNPDMRIKIIGHTDSVGSESSNQKLSEGRAKSVRNDMISRGIDPSRIEFEGRGESEPIDTNDTEEGRSKNRRVEFEILSSDVAE